MCPWDRLTKEAITLTRQAERDRSLSELESYMSEPDYKHDMIGGPAFGFPTGDTKGMTPDGGVVPDPTQQRYQGYEPIGAMPMTKATREFLHFARSGEIKASLVEDATGLTVVPTDFAGVILKELPRVSFMREISYVRPTTLAQVDIGSVSLTSAGWGKMKLGTTPADPLGATPAAKDSIMVKDLNALVKIGRDELMDADESLAETIRQGVALKMAEQMDDAFVFGDGVNQPFGVARSTLNPIPAGQTITASAIRQFSDDR